jgi:pyrimidine deaminase RibD-like protein
MCHVALKPQLKAESMSMCTFSPKPRTAPDCLQQQVRASVSGSLREEASSHSEQRPMEEEMSPTTGPTQEQADAPFMELALRQATTAITRGQTPFGAVVVDRARHVIGEGHNTVRADLDPTAHGEVVAIREAWRRLGSWQSLRGSTLYSSRTMPAVLLRHHANRLQPCCVRGTWDGRPDGQAAAGCRPGASGGVGECPARLELFGSRWGLQARACAPDHCGIPVGRGADEGRPGACVRAQSAGGGAKGVSQKWGQLTSHGAGGPPRRLLSAASASPRVGRRSPLALL